MRSLLSRPFENRHCVFSDFISRNLSAYDRSILALKLKPVIAAKAKENMLAGIKFEDPIQIFGEGSSSQNETIQKTKPTAKERTTNAQIAKAAGVSDETIRKVEKIEAQATPEIKAATLPNQQASRADLKLGVIEMTNLNPRQEKFICEFIACGNATAAYKAAYGSNKVLLS